MSELMWHFYHSFLMSEWHWSNGCDKVRFKMTMQYHPHIAVILPWAACLVLSSLFSLCVKDRELKFLTALIRQSLQTPTQSAFTCLNRRPQKGSQWLSPLPWEARENSGHPVPAWLPHLSSFAANNWPSLLWFSNPIPNGWMSHLYVSWASSRQHFFQMYMVFILSSQQPYSDLPQILQWTSSFTENLGFFKAKLSVRISATLALGREYRETKLLTPLGSCAARLLHVSSTLHPSTTDFCLGTCCHILAPVDVQWFKSGRRMPMICFLLLCSLGGNEGRRNQFARREKATKARQTGPWGRFGANEEGARFGKSSDCFHFR